MHGRLNAAHLEHVELDKGFSDERPASQEDPTWAAIAFWVFVMLTIAAVGFYGSVTA